MSVVALTEVFFGDLLTEVDMKPWWEKIRGYCFAVTVGVAVWTLETISLSPSVDCLPLASNLTSSANSTCNCGYTEPEAAFVSSVCVKQLPWHLSKCGMVNLAIVVILALVTSFWMHHPHVINSFRSYAKVEQLLDKSFVREELFNRESILSIMKSQERRAELGKIRNLALKIEQYTLTIKIYYIRCILLAIVALACSGYMSFTVYQIVRDPANFTCIADRQNRLVNERFVCSHDISEKLIPFQCVLLGMLILQSILCVLPLIWTFPVRQRHRSKARSVIIPDFWIVGYFIECFWKNSRPVGEGKFRQFVMFLVTENNTTRTLRHLCYTQNTDIILSDLERFVHDPHASLSQDIVEDLVEILDYRAIEFPGVEKVIPPILSSMAKKKYAELFMATLHSYSGEMTNEIKRILYRVNLHEIWQPFPLSCSLLYFLVSRRKQQILRKRAFYRLLQYSGDKRKVLVYTRNIAMTSDDFFGQHSAPLGNILATRSLVKGIPECDLMLTPSEYSRLEEVSKNYAVNPLDNGDSYVKTVYKIASKIARRRFLRWSDDMKQLARAFYDNKQWILFVELLNSFQEAPDEEKQDCGIYDFTVDVRDGDEIFGSILYYALKKPQFRFTFNDNAAHHILQFTEQQQRRVWDPDGNEFSASELFWRYYRGTGDTAVAKLLPRVNGNSCDDTKNGQNRNEENTMECKNPSNSTDFQVSTEIFVADRWDRRFSQNRKLDQELEMKNDPKIKT